MLQRTTARGRRPRPRARRGEALGSSTPRHMEPRLPEPEPEAEPDESRGISLPKLRPCTCEKCNPEDGWCRACCGAIATANPLPPSTERFDLTPLFSFGVVADVQYADLPVWTNFLKTVQRYYRHSLDALSMAVQSWLRDGPGGTSVAFVAQLGDLIDGKNADHGQTAAAVADVHRVLSRLGDIPIHAAIGNHEVMNWPRSFLHAARVTSEGQTNPVSEIMSASHLRALAAPEPEDQQAAVVEVGPSEESSYSSYRVSTTSVLHPLR